MTEMYAASDVPPGLAQVVILFALVALLAGVVLFALRARARFKLAREAAASIDSAITLLEGAEVVLSGTVRHLADQDVAVKVSITQEGFESESTGGWSHSWNETGREVVVAPFLLELVTGEIVRVDPPKNVDVADALDQKVWVNTTTRVCSAELVPGERIFVRGRLERSDIASPQAAYRDVTWGWAVVPARGQMLLSSEPLGDGMRQRGRFHRLFAIVGLALFLLCSAIVIPYVRRMSGETVSVTVVKKTYYTSTDDDGNITGHDGIDFTSTVPLDSKHAEIDSVNAGRILEGETVAVRRASASNWNLGPKATLGWFWTIFLFIVPMAFWLLYLIRRRASRPWFRRKLNERGTGRLENS